MNRLPDYYTKVQTYKIVMMDYHSRYMKWMRSELNEVLPQDGFADVIDILPAELSKGIISEYQAMIKSG